MGKHSDFSGFACVMQDSKLLSFNVQWFRDLGAWFSGFGCFVFESWVLRLRVLGASFSKFGCFVFAIWVLRASVLVFEFWVLRFRDLGASCFVLRSSFSSASFSKLPLTNVPLSRIALRYYSDSVTVILTSSCLQTYVVSHAVTEQNVMQSCRLVEFTV